VPLMWTALSRRHDTWQEGREFEQASACADAAWPAAHALTCHWHSAPALRQVCTTIRDACLCIIKVLLWFVELYVFLGHCAVPEVLLAMLL